MESFKAIIFDMDGVLLLSTPVHEYAYKEIFSKIGINNICYSRIAGMRTDESIKKVLKENRHQVSFETIAELAKEKTLLSNLLMKENTPIVPGCKEVLIDLKLKYKLALVSSASVMNIDLFLNASGSEELFEFVINGKEVKNAKPDPDIYLLALSKLKLQPEECLVIEDAVNGVVAAKNAGITVYGIPGTVPVNELEKAGANRIIKDIYDLLD